MATVTKPRKRASLRRVIEARTIITTAVIVVVAYLGVVPFVYLIGRTFIDESGITLSNISRALTHPRLLDAVWNTFIFGAGTAVVAVVGGTFLAYLVARTDIGMKPLLYAIGVVPLVIPGLLYTIAWIMLAGPRAGILTPLVGELSGINLNVFTITGMVFIDGTSWIPLVFLFMVAAFRSMDPSLEEAAFVSGAPVWRVFLRITMPLSRPALFAGTLIVVIRAVEAFETPLFVGIPAGVEVLITRVWQSLVTFPPDIEMATSYAVVLVVVAGLGVFWYNRLRRNVGQFETVTGKGFRARGRELGRWRYLMGTIVAIYAIVTIVLPALVIIYASLIPSVRPPTASTLSTISLDNYRAILSNPLVLTGFKNSIILALSAATTVMLMMSVVAWLVVRTQVRGGNLLDALAFSPMVYPGLVMGLALLHFYLRVPLPVYGTLLILFVAYVTRYMPYGLRYASASMYQIQADLEHSAAVHGATWAKTFRRVTFPLLFPGLLSGWLYIVMISIRELSSSILLYSGGSEVLAISMYVIYEDGRTTEVAAIGTLLIALLLGIVIVAYTLGSRVGIRFGDTE